MHIQNALVYTKDFRFVRKDVFTDGEHFSHQSGDPKVIDAKDLYLIPGLIDIHLHGCGGYDFCDGTKEAFDAICAYQGKHGVTGVSLASMAFPADVLSHLFQQAASYPNETGAVFLGICMEGPFLNPEKKGAQKGSYLALPDERLFFSLLDSAKGKLQTLCIAPELPGAEKLIPKAKDREKGDCCGDYLLYRRFRHCPVRTSDADPEGIQSDRLPRDPGHPDPVYCPYDRDKDGYEIPRGKKRQFTGAKMIMRRHRKDRWMQQ